ncbi:MAG: dicarboxylate/amino acid:cation symporter [Spirochaetales bacterium]|nr:dicarboxylate/amino acid:cation symporter [Spirochaetales bacterium]
MFFSTLTPAKEALSPALSASLNMIPIICIAAIAGIIIYMLYRKRASVQREWNVTTDTIGAVSEQIRQRLSAMKASKREITAADLLLEEITVRMLNNGADSVSVRIRRIFGEISLVIADEGEEYNPFASLSEWDTESEDYYRDMIFRSYQSSLAYSRRNKRNIVTVSVHTSDNKAAAWTFAAMILGIGFGFLMKIMPESVSSFINDNILSLVQNLFMNALRMLIAPVVFFALTTGMMRLSGGRELGRIGGRTVGMFVFTSIVSLGFGIGVAYLFFSGPLPDISSMIAGAAENSVSVQKISFTQMIEDIIPKNLVSPVLSGNMVQVIFVSIFVGLAMSALDDKIGSLRVVFDEASTLFVRLVSMVIRCMPIVAFSAMAMLICQNSAATIGMLMMFLLAVVVGFVVLMLMNSLLILILGRLSPLPYLKKALGYLPTIFMISSSSACIPLTLSTVRQKLGVSEKVSSFVIPIGATVNMNGTCMINMLSTMLFLKLFDVPVTGGLIVKLALLAFLLAVGSPGVPNSSLITLTMMLSIVGIPTAAIGVVIGIWNIVDRIITVNNVNGDITTAVILSAAEKDLDKDVYNA